LAAEKSGDKEHAQQYYSKLAAQTANSDAAREELKRIRQNRTAAGGTTTSNQLATDR